MGVSLCGPNSFASMTAKYTLFAVLLLLVVQVVTGNSGHAVLLGNNASISFKPNGGDLTRTGSTELTMNTANGGTGKVEMPGAGTVNVEKLAVEASMHTNSMLVNHTLNITGNAHITDNLHIQIFGDMIELTPAIRGGKLLMNQALSESCRGPNWVVPNDIRHGSGLGVSVYDLAVVDVEFVGFRSGFCIHNSDYCFLAPYSHHKLVRFAPSASLTGNHVDFLDLGAMNSSLTNFETGWQRPYGGDECYMAPGSHGTVIQFDAMAFSPVTTSYFTLTVPYRGYRGGFADGSYSYYTPTEYSASVHGFAARVAHSQFNNGGTEYLDFTTFDSDLVCFIGGATYNGHAYYYPCDLFLNTPGNLFLRVDTSDFTITGMSTLSLAADAEFTGFYNGVLDDNNGFAYLLPSRYHKLVRVDLHEWHTDFIEGVDMYATNPELNDRNQGVMIKTNDANMLYMCSHDPINGNGVVGQVRVPDDFHSEGIKWLDLTDINPAYEQWYGCFLDENGAMWMPEWLGGKLARLPLTPVHD